MHKSWGNAIEFDEAAERMGVDVMRWMYARRASRGQHPVRLARGRRGAARAARAVERVRVLRHLRAARGLDARRRVRPPVARAARARPLDPVAVGGGRGRRSRPACATTTPKAATRVARRVHRRPLDLVPAPVAPADVARARAPTATRRSRRSMRRSSRSRRTVAPILPFLSDTVYANLVAAVDDAAPDSVHLTRWPRRRAGAAAGRAAGGGRGGRAARGRPGAHAPRPGGAQGPPAARAACGSRCPGRDLAERDALLELIRDEANVKAVELIGDESELVDRRREGRCCRGSASGSASQIPAVMAAAREGAVEIHPDGSVTLAGETLAPDEVEIQATPRPGTAVAHDDGPGRDHRHDADPRAASPRATRASSSGRSRTCARRPASTSTTGSSCGWTASRRTWRRTSRRSPRTRSSTRSATTAPAGGRHGRRTVRAERGRGPRSALPRRRRRA